MSKAVLTNDNMPKTIFRRKTFGCPTCYWNTDNPVAEGIKCPRRGCGFIIHETDPERMGTITIMGPEDIDDEILKMDDERVKEEKVKMTQKEKDDHKVKRLQDIQDALSKHLPNKEGDFISS